jgi:dynein heavy chain
VLALDGSKINMDDLNNKLSDENNPLRPYQDAFKQECEKLNILIGGIMNSLTDLDLAYRGELTMNEAMENLEDCIKFDRVPPQWKKIAYPSERALISWTENIKARLD